MIEWLASPAQWSVGETFLAVLIVTNGLVGYLVVRRLRALYYELRILRLITHGVTIGEAVEHAKSDD